MFTEGRNMKWLKDWQLAMLAVLLTLTLLIIGMEESKAEEMGFLNEFEYSLGGSQSKLHYCWYGASEACFKYNLSTIRLEAEHKSGFAGRIGYGMNSGSDTQTTITNQVFKIKLDRYMEFEILYKYWINDKLGIYLGIGHYMQTVPIYSPDDILIHYDEDNDRGVFSGVEFQLTKRVAIEAFVKQTSNIGNGGSCDQECIDNWEAKGSTIRQVGVGFNWKF